MSTLIVIVLFGLGFAFLSTQNTSPATFSILSYTWTLPMYMIVFGALLIGFFISWIVSSIGSLGDWFSILGKDSKIRQTEHTVSQLQTRIRDLELENAKLQGHDDVTKKEVTVIKERPANFFDRFRLAHSS